MDFLFTIKTLRVFLWICALWKVKAALAYSK